MFCCEAVSLNEPSNVSGLVVPRPILAGEFDKISYLVLEYIHFSSKIDVKKICMWTI